ncbi:hypothetical protein FQN50_005957 [Emmonsiellopsis sp. PD_5]|nr:hypothetical protein FQN50_005957 [Emmonsiellopsis sp. PD_5]
MPSLDTNQLLDEKTWEPPGDLQHDDGTFIFLQPDTMALLKYVWEGMMLPTTKEEYCTSLGIVAADIEKAEVWEEVEKVLGTFTQIKTDTTQFNDVTWNTTNHAVDEIMNYSANAGIGSEYEMMLRWIQEYSEEENKPSPDQRRLEYLQRNLVLATDDKIEPIAKLLQYCKEAKDGLAEFRRQCDKHHKDIAGHSNSFKSIIEAQLEVITQVRNDLKSARDQIDQIVKDGSMSIAIHQAGKVWRHPLFSVSGIGALLGLTDQINKPTYEAIQKNIAHYEGTIKNLNTKLRSEMNIDSDIGRMEKNLADITLLVESAITTIERLQGDWATIHANLDGIRKLVSSTGHKRMPTVEYGEAKINTITKRWQDLNTSVWVKVGVCSADSLINLALLVLGYVPGLLHAWYIILKYPETDEEYPEGYQPIVGANGRHDPESGRVTYYYVAHQPPSPHAGSHPHPQRSYGTNQPPHNAPGVNPATRPQPQPSDPHTSSVTGDMGGEGSSSHPEGRAPPTYAEAVKGDHKVQTQD